MPSFFANASQFLARLSLGQKVALGSVLIGGIAILVGIAHWANQPDYALLFGQLEPTDASRVVETLQAEGLTYELREQGTAVYVPRQQVYDLRLRFAGEGVISDGPIGYELFDGGTLGMTDFMQKLNYKRALEGELARTVSNVRQVSAARVHLVLPERSAFRDQQTRPSASVVLQVSGGSRLDQRQIEGVASLVAGAVEGMAISDVTVLDTRGTLLSDPNLGDPDLALTSNQLDTQRAVEDHLTGNGQSMLDRVLGPGRAVVRVSADLDFSRTVTEGESIDPESATIISEERLEEQAGPDGSNSAVRNYEISRTRQRTERNAGEIETITVSVVLDQRPAVRTAAVDDEEAPPAEPEPYTEQELREIEDLVKNAVGFNPERGDRFAIHQARFDTSVDDQIVGEMQEIEDREQLNLYLRYGLMALALALAAFLVRSATQSVVSVSQDPMSLVTAGVAPEALQGRTTAAQLAGRAGEQNALPPAQKSSGAGSTGPDANEEEFVLANDMYTSKLSPEAKARIQAKKQLYEEVQQGAINRPEDAAELLSSWIAEDINTDDL